MSDYISREAAIEEAKKSHLYFDIKPILQRVPAADVRLEIFQAIQQLTDRRYRMVLLGRYYECLPWPDIATLMHYDERQVYRFHGMALTAIEPIIKKEE